MIEQQVQEYDIHSIEYGLKSIAGKWKPEVIYALSNEKVLRYGELRRQVGSVSNPVLAKILKELAADGVISRHQYDVLPPRVEYELTAKGESVIPLLQQICRWSASYK